MSKKNSLWNLKSKLTLFIKYKTIIVNTLFAATAIIVATYYITNGQELHGLFLRHVVGSKVYMIKGKVNGGGGTGFAIEAPSGISYIITNSHVCEGVLEQSEDKTSVLVMDDEGKIMRRRIIEISDFTDLCLLEGLPGIEGLSTGNEPYIGQIVTAIGHPSLRPLSLSSGEIIGISDVHILEYVMKTGIPLIDFLTRAKDDACDGPKNEIQEVKIDKGTFTLRLCTVVTRDAYSSTITIYGGNSGSPVVTWTGAVIGVAFAADSTNWAHIVSLRDLERFISRY